MAQLGYLTYAFDFCGGGMVTALAVADRADEIERICLFYPALCIPDDQLEKFEGKVLLVHGTKDTTVPISYSDRAASDEGYGSQCEYHIIEGGKHGFKCGYRKQSLTYTVKFMIQ